MTSTGFENYAEALKIYLAKYREVSSSALGLSRLPLTRPLFFHAHLHAVDTYKYIDHCLQSQSQRGEAQQARPGSGYGAQASQPSAASASTAGQSDPSSSTAYPGQEGGSNNILSPHGPDPSQQLSGYGNVYPPSSSNNGVGNDPYQ